VRGLLVTANLGPSSPILVTLMMEELLSSETSVLRRTKRHNIPEDSNLHFKMFLSISLYEKLETYCVTFQQISSFFGTQENSKYESFHSLALPLNDKLAYMLL
jgi:hypothetical protein